MAGDTMRPSMRGVDRRGEGAKGANLIGSELLTAIVLIAVSLGIVLASRVLGAGFGSLEQIRAILLISSFLMVVAFGQQMVILTGGLDLSVASTMTLGGILGFSWIGGSIAALFWAIPSILLITGAIGACSGLCVSILRIPPFIVTLAVGIILYGAVLGITQGTPTGAGSPFLSSLFAHAPLGTPIIYLMVIVTVLGWLFQVRTSFGRKLYALGTNPIAAHVAGLPVRRVIILTYAISGATAGLAGILAMGYASGATLTMGQSYLLPSVAAAVIGGTSIVGGRGIFPGAVAGAILLTTLSTIVSSLGVAVGWRTIVNGVVIFIALVMLRDDLRVWVQQQVKRVSRD